MTETEWLTRTEPETMLGFLGAKVSKRKTRLFCLACYRRYSWLDDNEESRNDERSKNAVVIAERFADEHATCEELRIAHEAACDARYEVGRFAYYAAECASPLLSAETCMYATDAGKKENAARSILLRDIFGNPFRPLRLDPAWLDWNAGTVRKLAQTIYDERRFGDLPILADALEEAGCDEAAVLEHCRGPGPHVRGCWVVDLILGKE